MCKALTTILTFRSVIICVKDASKKLSKMTNTSNHQPSGLSEDNMVALLVSRLEEGHKQSVIFLKAFVIYIGIHGLLLKLWLDASEQTDRSIKITIAITAIFVCFLVGYVWPAWISIRRNLESDISKLNSQLGYILTTKELVAMKHITMTSGLFAIVSLGGWAILLWMSF